MFREGYSLSTGAVLAALLGVPFWILVARRYPPHAVGVNAAAISALTLAGGVAALLVIGLVVRFVPHAGSATVKLVGASYAVCAGGAVVSASVVLAGLSVFAPQLHGFLDASTGMVVTFVAATVVWSLFSLQDQVLTALQRAVLVPVDNTLFAVTKIVLVTLLSATLVTTGIFISWVVSSAIAVVVITLVMVRIMIREQGSGRTGDPLSLRELAGFAAVDYFGSLFWLLSISLTPIIVTVIVGATSNAYFALPFQMAMLLYYLPMTIGTAFLAATVRDPQRFGANLRGVFVQVMCLVVPASVVLAGGAPYLLRVFGPSYASNGAGTLELLALAGIPCACGMLAVNAERFRRRMGRVLLIRTCQSLPQLAVMVPCLRAYGIVGAAGAWLATQSVVALGLLLVSRDSVIGHGSERHSDARGPGSRVGRPLLLFRVKALGALRRIAATTHALGVRHWIGGTLRSSKCRATVAPLLPAVAATLEDGPAHVAGRDWMVVRVVPTEMERAVVMLGNDSGSVVVLKAARSRRGIASLEREAAVLRLFRDDRRFAAWRGMAPEPLGGGEVNGCRYTVEEALVGLTLRELMSSPRVDETLRETGHVIRRIHVATARVQRVGGVLLSRWVDRPAHGLIEGLESRGRGVGWRRQVLQDVLDGGVRDCLSGRQMEVGLVHGDLCPGHVMVDSSGHVVGVVDWEHARDGYPVLLDSFALMLSIRAQQQRSELGSVVVDLLGTGRLSRDERRWMGVDGQTDAQLSRALVLLTWLHLVTTEARESPKGAVGTVWRSLNVDRVLLAARA